MTSFELQKKIHDCVKEKLAVGMSEKELGEIISEICPDWQGDLISGERTAEIEGAPSDRIIKNGDVVLLDLQIKSQNEWSDLTRVYFMGGISEEQEEGYEKIKNALEVGESLLYPGMKASEIYKKVREAVNSSFCFDHHAGHRVGNDEIVVEPRFVPESEDELKEGMVVTLEPGIYFPGKFGIRLENNYLITKNGFLRLDDLSLDKTDYIVKG